MIPLHEKVDNVLCAAHVNYVIAGGYARDLFYGATPRDCDVWIFGDYHALKRDLENTPEAKNITSSNTYCDSHIDYVFHMNGIDFILCNSTIRHREELLHTFDFNLNQFYMDDEGNPQYGGLGRPPRTALDVLLLKNRPEDRVQYILDKVNKLFGPKPIDFTELL